MFMRAVHPGEVLKGELEELGITPTELARQIEVPANRVSQIIAGKRSVTGDTALRLGHWFGVDPQFWLNLQAQYDLVQADREGSHRSSRKRQPRNLLLLKPESPDFDLAFGPLTNSWESRTAVHHLGHTPRRTKFPPQT